MGVGVGVIASKSHVRDAHRILCASTTSDVLIHRTIKGRNESPLTLGLIDSVCMYRTNEEEEEEKILSYFLSSPIASMEIANLSLSMKVATASPPGGQTYASSRSSPRQLSLGMFISNNAWTCLRRRTHTRTCASTLHLNQERLGKKKMARRPTSPPQHYFSSTASLNLERNV